MSAFKTKYLSIFFIDLLTSDQWSGYMGSVLQNYWPLF
jgi:hypothetical protein